MALNLYNCSRHPLFFLAPAVAAVAVVLQRSRWISSVPLIKSVNKIEPVAMPDPVRFTQLGSSLGPGLEYSPTGGYDSVVIFMHGLGDEARGWSDALQEIFASMGSPRTKLIVPTAPQRPITLMGGMTMTAWADLEGLTPSSPEDVAGWKQSAKRVRDIIDHEVRDNNVSAKRVFVGGFSQGGAVAYLTGLNYPQTLGGIIALSTWLPMSSTLKSELLSEEAVHTPILSCHGTTDMIVAFEWGSKTVDTLKQAGLNVEFKKFPYMDHGVSPTELKDIADFISSRLNVKV